MIEGHKHQFLDTSGITIISGVPSIAEITLDVICLVLKMVCYSATLLIDGKCQTPDQSNFAADLCRFRTTHLLADTGDIYNWKM